MTLKREESQELFTGQPTLFDIEADELTFSASSHDPLAAKLASDNARAELEKRLKNQVVEVDEQGVAKPSVTWGNLYNRLVGLGWQWRVATYIAWAASKKIGRVPSTQEQLATDYLGLTSDRAINKWRAANPKIDEIVGTLQTHYIFDYIPDAIEAMGISASQPNKEGNRDRKLMFEMLGMYQPSMRIKEEKTPVENDLAGIPADVLKKRREELSRLKSAEDPDNG